MKVLYQSGLIVRFSKSSKGFLELTGSQVEVEEVVELEVLLLVTPFSFSATSSTKGVEADSDLLDLSRFLLGLTDPSVAGATLLKYFSNMSVIVTEFGDCGLLFKPTLAKYRRHGHFFNYFRTLTLLKKSDIV